MALRKTPKSKPMTEEHDVLVENEFTAGDEHEASAAIEPIVEDAAEPVAPSLEQPIEAAVEAIPAQAVHVNEALAGETAKEAEASAWRAVEAAAVVALDFAAPVKAASEWRKTTAEAWNDSAVALFDLASALTKARTVSEVIDLQARFARERFGGLAKLSSDYVELAQRTAKDAGAAAFRFSKSA